jgi:hypothetical protein
MCILKLLKILLKYIINSMSKEIGTPLIIPTQITKEK